MPGELTLGQLVLVALSHWPVKMRGPMQIPLPPLDRAAAAPLREQIAVHLDRAIRGGQLRPGDKLPPIRDLASRFGVTRSTVQGAYQRLADAGLVSGTVGRGTVVLESDAVAQASDPSISVGGSSFRADPSLRDPHTNNTLGGNPLSHAVGAVLEHAQSLPGAPSIPAARPTVADFASLTPDRSSFPVDALRSVVDEVLRHRGDELLDYDRGEALHPDAVAPLLCGDSSQDAACTASDPRPTAAETPPDERVVITSGAQQAIDLVVRCCTSPGDVVAVPVPTYPQLTGVLRAASVDIAPVRWGAHGPDLDQLADVLRNRRPRLLCMMPTFHNPTGRSLGAVERERLMRLLLDHGTVVLEDEYQRPLRFRGEAPPTLRELDARRRTVTVHSLSKHLFPGMRVGWIQGPEGLLQPIAALKRAVDLGSSPLLLGALMQFAREGHLRRHTDAMRASLQVRHGAAQQALRGKLPQGAQATDPDGGLALWLELPGAGLGDQLAERAAAHGVRVTPGRAFDPWSRPSPGCRIAVARSNPDEIERGLEVLVRCAHELVGGDHRAALVL